MRLARERVLDLAGAARQPRQSRRVEPFRREAFGELAHARSRVARIFVGGVADIGERVGVAIGDELALGDAEQGTQQRDAVAVGTRRHRSQPADAGAAQQAKQRGLRLIVEMMGGDDRLCADLARVRPEQGVARRAARS